MSGLDDISQREVRDLCSAIVKDVPDGFREQISMERGVDGSGGTTVELRLAQGIRWFRVGNRQELLVEVADAVQDFVCDEWGAPWPEVISSAGEFVEVLEPRLRDGRAVWAGRVVSGDVGDLRAAVARTGLRLR